MDALNRQDRASGALLGLALGDALGMPSQTFTRAEIYAAYGEISDFRAPITGHPVSHGLDAAQVTDDTEQTLLLAELLIASPDHFDEQQWAMKLLAWEEDVKRRGIHDLLGPSSKRALEMLLQGTRAQETGINGSTNGAAMRISPIGITTPVEPVARFVDCVERTCRVTHNTATAISSASAVAAVISAGVEGASFEEAIPPALAAAREGAKRGNLQHRVDIAAQIERALELADSAFEKASIDALDEQIGTGVASEESIPTAFAVTRLAGGDAWRAGLISANIGGDTDTIGAIAGAMAGACSGASALPGKSVNRIVQTNHLFIDDLVDALLAIRVRYTSRTEVKEHVG